MDLDPTRSHQDRDAGENTGLPRREVLIKRKYLIVWQTERVEIRTCHRALAPFCDKSRAPDAGAGVGAGARLLERVQPGGQSTGLDN